MRGLLPPDAHEFVSKIGAFPGCCRELRSAAGRAGENLNCGGGRSRAPDAAQRLFGAAPQNRDPSSFSPPRAASGERQANYTTTLSRFAARVMPV